jgi:hypothetical protein
MKKLSALETGLGTAAETQINVGKNTYETDDKKIGPKFNSCTHNYLTEHLASMFRKQPFKID